MTIWIGGVHLPNIDLRFLHEPSNTWLRLRPHQGDGAFWDVAANVFNNGENLLPHSKTVGKAGASFPEGGANLLGMRGSSWIVFKPLPPNLVRHPTAPPTGPHDFALTARACDQSGNMWFEFTDSSIVSNGIVMETFGPNHLPPTWPG